MSNPQDFKRRIDFLEGVIDRLQAALGLVVQVEPYYIDKARIGVAFNIILSPVVWEEAKKHNAVREAINITIKYKLEKLLKEGKNGWVKEVDTPKT